MFRREWILVETEHGKTPMAMRVKECPMATFTDNFSKWLKDAKSLGVRIVEVPLPLPPGMARALDDFVVFNKLQSGFLSSANTLNPEKMIFILQGKNLEKFMAFLKENNIRHDDWEIKPFEGGYAK
jgi:hypothetical protein